MQHFRMINWYSQKGEREREGKACSSEIEKTHEERGENNIEGR